MKTFTLKGVVALLLLMACHKTVDTSVAEDGPASLARFPADSFTHYIIKKGKHFSEQHPYVQVETDALVFTVKFDSSAIYQTASAENQYDINKLYGFSDNEAHHHQFSARFGWRWSDGALRLFAYVYNNGSLASKEIGTVPIGEEIKCSIKITATDYVFTAGEYSLTMPRQSTTLKAKGYQLYPYFGGDEAAPHDVAIWIKAAP